MNHNLYIIEPNLKGLSGHYAEFVFALRNACLQSDTELLIHANPLADSIFATEEKIQIIKISPRTNDFLGEWRILWHRLRGHDPFLILTANVKHVLFITLASLCLGKKPTHCFFYFHWIENKFHQRLFHWFSKRTRSHAIAITPTDGIAQSLKNKKWKHVHAVPYPALPPSESPTPQAFSKVLLAGAARINKGLPLITELAELLEKSKSHTFELWIQISPKHTTKQGSRESHYIDRLRKCTYPYLHLDERTPNRSEYMERFKGALVLAIYDQKKFAHGVSGIVLDALLAGSPIITTKNTWAGNQIEHFKAGSTITLQSPQELLNKIDHIVSYWNNYENAAIHSAQELKKIHSPKHLLKLISDYSNW